MLVYDRNEKAKEGERVGNQRAARAWKWKEVLLEGELVTSAQGYRDRDRDSGGSSI